MVLRFGVAHSLERTRAELRAAIQAHLDSLHEPGDSASAGLEIVEQAPRPTAELADALLALIAR